MLALLKTFSWQELRQHPWRNAAAIVAVMLGVALAFSVHLINASALDEFAQAARSVGGQSDLELRAVRGHLDEALYPQMARRRGVALSSPVLEISSYVITPAGKRPLRIIGVDAVSYTHLDVYKRQAHSSSRWAANWRRVMALPGPCQRPTCPCLLYTSRCV